MIIKTNRVLVTACLLAVMPVGIAPVSAAAPKTPETQLTAAGQKLEARYADQLKALQTEIERTLPKIDEQMKSALQKAGEALKAAEADAQAAQQSLGKIQGAKALVEHAKGKWIGGAEKGINQAEAAIKKATTEAEREAAEKDLAKWQANKEDGVKELKKRQEALDKAKIDEPKMAKASEAAKAVLAKAQADELLASKALLNSVESYLASDQLDVKLVKCAVLAEATPRGLAEFAQQGKEQEALVDKLLATWTLRLKTSPLGNTAWSWTATHRMRFCCGGAKCSRTIDPIISIPRTMVGAIRQPLKLKSHTDHKM